MLLVVWLLISLFVYFVWLKDRDFEDRIEFTLVWPLIVGSMIPLVLIYTIHKIFSLFKKER